MNYNSPPENPNRKKNKDNKILISIILSILSFIGILIGQFIVFINVIACVLAIISFVVAYQNCQEEKKNLVALIFSICLVVTGGVSLVNGIKIKIDKTITYHNYYEFYNNAYPHEFDWEFEVYE